MAAGHHLGFDVTRYSAIRSADPENPTLEPNMKCIGSPVAEIWPFVYLGALEPHLGEGEEGVSDGTIRKSDGGFLKAVHCERCTVCNHSAAICDRMSPTLKSTGGWVTFGHISFPGVPLGVAS